MIACGIDLKGSDAIFVILSKNNGIISDKTGSFTKVSLENDEDYRRVQSFFDTVKMGLDSAAPDRIGIIKRHKNGDFAGGSVSFKMEGLIQLYKNKNMRLISWRTVQAFRKKTNLGIKPQYNYQDKAFWLAVYLLEN